MYVAYRTCEVSAVEGRKVKSDGITEFEEFTVNVNGGNSIMNALVGATAFVVVCSGVGN